jgi:hypothetical protein
VLDRDDVYFFVDQVTKAESKASGDQRTIGFAGDVELPGEAAITRDFVITNTKDGKTVRVRKTGGEPETLRNPGCHNIVASDEKVYCTGKAGGSAYEVLLEIPIAGGSERVVTRDLLDVFVVEGGVIFASTVREIVRIEIATGQSRQLAAVQTELITGLAIDETDVYFSDASGEGSSGAIRRVSKNGGDVGIVLQIPIPARQIAVDATHVYWTAYGLAAVRKAGGPLVEVARTGEPLLVSHRGARALQIDATHVYWSAYDDIQGEGVIRRAEKLR